MTMTMTNTIARSLAHARVYLIERQQGKKGAKATMQIREQRVCLFYSFVLFLFFGLFPRSIDRSGRVGRIVQRECVRVREGERRLLDG